MAAWVGVVACDPDGGSDEPAAPSNKPTPEPAEPTGPAGAEATASTPGAETAVAPQGPDRLLRWLDPKAGAVLFMRDYPRALDPESVAVVFALPPAASRLMEDVTAVETGLEAMLGEAGEASPASWLGNQAMAMRPSVSQGNTVVHSLGRPKADVIALLDGNGMSLSKLDGFDVLQPLRSFRFKIVFLDDTTAAFVPAAEIGSGTGPLTAARDLPPSDMRTQLETLLADDTGIVLALHAGGPALHLDLSDDILATQLGLKSMPQSGALEGQILLQTSGSLDAAIQELNTRSHPEESNQIQALMKRLQFGPEGPMAAARVVLTKADQVHLERP
jgi:hypothetical protein